VPETGKIYSFNEGNYALWDEPTRKYMDSLKEPSKWGGKPYSARYIGSLVRVCVRVSVSFTHPHL
jgi:fructose-1,6-bisphosphatase I